MIDDKKLTDFVLKVLFPFWRREDYIKKLSTRKLVRIAERLITEHIPLYSASEAVYEEMIRRLKDRAGNEEFIAKLMKEERVKNELG